MKNILITGGAGYIGSHAVLNFAKNTNYNIVIFDNLSTGHIETIKTLQKFADIKFEKGDLKNIQEIETVFSKYNFDAVMHFAAFTLVGESVEAPSKYYRNNTFGTLNLLDTMIKHDVKKIVFSSTCSTYGDPQYMPLDENHPQKPINPYGISKFFIEQILKDFDTAYGLKSIILRYFNVAGCDKDCNIGEWHTPETHLIPNILKSTFESGKEFKIFGDDYDTPDGTCIRDYLDVEDLTDAHRLALDYLDKKNESDIFNLGTENGNSVKDIFSICEKIIEKKISVKVEARRSGDTDKLFANASKAKNILGWQPKRSLEASIKSVYEWEKRLNKILSQR